ncbi:MAG: cupin [Acidiferrobacteraceae bacterium]|nr:cupin [Acidiferrobacteraceae bacterium]|tara:strand:- start:92 stop:436 length:345 start_codon:yes stop_codon:yes gene_type:complete
MSRTVTKPWGLEFIWAETDKYVGKKLLIAEGKRLSRQYHEKKDETIYVIRGPLTLEIGEGDDIVQHRLFKSDTYHISPGTVHRFCAYDGNVELMEVSTPELDDVVRLEDDFSRE